MTNVKNAIKWYGSKVIHELDSASDDTVIQKMVDNPAFLVVKNGNTYEVAVAFILNALPLKLSNSFKLAEYDDEDTAKKTVHELSNRTLQVNELLAKENKIKHFHLQVYALPTSTEPKLDLDKSGYTVDILKVIYMGDFDNAVVIGFNGSTLFFSDALTATMFLNNANSSFNELLDAEKYVKENKEKPSDE